MKANKHSAAYLKALEYRKEQMEVLTSLDPKKLLALLDKWSPPPVRARMRANHAAYGDIFLLTAMHKSRVALMDFPPELRMASVKWLTEHGFSAKTAEELLEIREREESPE